MLEIKKLKAAITAENHISFRGGFAIATDGGTTIATPTTIELGLAPRGMQLLKNVEASEGSVFTTTELNGQLSVKLGRRTLKVAAMPVNDVPHNVAYGQQYTFDFAPQLRAFLKQCKGTSADSLSAKVSSTGGLVWWTDRSTLLATSLALPDFTVFVEDLTKVISVGEKIVSVSAGPHSVTFYYEDGSYAVALCVEPMDLPLKQRVLALLAKAGDLSLHQWDLQPYAKTIKDMLKAMPAEQVKLQSDAIVMHHENATLTEEVALPVGGTVVVKASALHAAINLSCFECVETGPALYFRSDAVCVAAFRFTETRP